MRAILHLWLSAGRVRRALGATMRTRREAWSEAELALLKHLMWLAEPDNVNFRQVVHLFPNHTWQGIQKRCACIRDLARRKERKQRLLAEQRNDGVQEPDSPTSVMAIPAAGRLHHTLVWVPPTDQEIGSMNLGT